MLCVNDFILINEKLNKINIGKIKKLTGDATVYSRTIQHLLTRQPPEGRSRDGLRFGEMEREAMYAQALFLVNLIPSDQRLRYSN